MPQPLWASQCRPGKTHRWEVSGWCTHGCGNRDDGRICNREGDELYSGPLYTAAELQEFRERLQAHHRPHPARSQHAHA